MMSVTTKTRETGMGSGILNVIRNVPPVVWALILMILFFTQMSPSFLTVSNTLNILRSGSILMILCMGVSVVMISGGIDLSVGAVMGLGGIAMAWTLVNWNLPIPLAMLISILAGLGGGLLNGFFVTQLKVPTFIASLGTMGMAHGLALVINDGYTISGLPDGLDAIGNGVLLGIPIPIWFAFFAFLLTFILMRYTAFGVYVYALGGNEEALELSGRPVWIYRALTYAYSGFMAGLAGIVVTARNMAAQPTVGLGMEFQAFSSVVLGGAFVAGRGSPLGTVAGVLFVLVLRNGLNVMGVPTYYQLAIIGIVLLAAIVLSILLERRLLSS